MEKPIDRVIKFLDENEINDNQFTKKTGLSQGWIGKARATRPSLTDKTLAKILKAYPRMNEVYITTGKYPSEIPDPEKVIKENETLKKELEEIKELNRALVKMINKEKGN